jgi:hypothetical protein
MKAVKVMAETMKIEGGRGQSGKGMCGRIIRKTFSKNVVAIEPEETEKAGVGRLPLLENGTMAWREMSSSGRSG